MSYCIIPFFRIKWQKKSAAALRPYVSPAALLKERGCFAIPSGDDTDMNDYHSMRLFVGLRPSDDFRAALSELQDRLRTAGVTGRFLDPSNLHMTLAFIGEWHEDVLPVLPRIARPFAVTLSHPGLFPEAKVLWAGVEASEALDRLAQHVRHNLAGCGIPFDPKPFYPHITLARKPSVPDGTALSEIEVPPAVMPVDEVCLFRSVHGENGMEYPVIGSVRAAAGR